jgi:hypothetical protein
MPGFIPQDYLHVLEHVTSCLHEICEPAVAWDEVSNPGRLRKGIPCDVDRFLEAQRLSSEVSQFVMFIGGKSLPSYYGP